jgi:hypothetical protein
MKDFSFLKKNRVPFRYKYWVVEENVKKKSEKVENIYKCLKVSLKIILLVKDEKTSKFNLKNSEILGDQRSPKSPIWSPEMSQKPPKMAKNEGSSNPVTPTIERQSNKTAFFI